jgi:hypothetical protein
VRKRSDVIVLCDVRESLVENGTSARFDFAYQPRRVSGAMEPELDSANASEQSSHAEVATLLGVDQS